jgi:hypothetical protein
MRTHNITRASLQPIGGRIISTRPTLLAIAAAVLSPGFAATQTGPSAAQTSESSEAEDLDNEIVVTGFRDIVVNGRARRCRPVAGDPLDDVDLSSGYDIDPHSGMPVPKYMAIIPDGQASYVSVPNTEQITGPEFWQRVGAGMDQYVFRAPSSDRPMCVGGRGGIDRFAGFRRIEAAAPYRGRRLRFTAWVATGRAQQVSFWLAAGTQWREKPRQFEVRRTDFYELLNGGNTNNVPFRGSHDWTPVLLETGPIHKDADHISYGFNLQGSGDVWVYEPKLEIVADGPEGGRRDDIIMIGRDQ